MLSPGRRRDGRLETWNLDAETLVFERTDAVSHEPVATISKEHLKREAVAHGKYAPLYRHLLSIGAGSAWSTTFAEVERILDFRLPASRASTDHGGRIRAVAAIVMRSPGKLRDGKPSKSTSKQRP